MVHLNRPIRPVRATREAPAQAQPGTIALRRLPVAGGGSRRTLRASESRGFSPRELHPSTYRAAANRSSVLPTLCAPSRRWESLSVSTRALTSSVATPMSLRAFHTSRSAVSRLAPPHHQRARAVDATHRLKNAARNHPGRLRPPLLGLAAEWTAHSGLLSPEVRQPEHHFHDPLEPA